MILYVSLIFRPLIMIGCDVYDHTFAEAKHILTVHAKYGANHLQVEIANTSNESNKNQNSVKSEDSVPSHIFTKEVSNTYFITETRLSYPKIPPQKLQAIFLSMQLPPPKLAA